MTARTLFGCVLAVLASACRDAAEAREAVHRAPRADGLVTGYSDQGARHVRTIVGFRDPESVRYDPEQDVFFVSSVAGFGSHKDGNGYITRIAAANHLDATIFVESGRDGVTLNAPKGMTLQGDTLWVTDIDVVRGFHRRTGAPVGTIDFSAHGPIQLNDIAAGPGGTLRVSDTGIQMVYEGNIHVGGDRVFSVGPGRVVRVDLSGPALNQPNGLAWDPVGNRWVMVSFHRSKGEVAVIGAPGDSSRVVLRTGAGQLDGIEPIPGGGLLFSSWADSSVHVLRDGRDTRIVREVPEPADIGVDTRRGRVLIPLTVVGQVQVWQLGPWWVTRSQPARD